MADVNLSKLTSLDLAGYKLTGNVSITSTATGTIDIKAGTITGDLTVDAKNATVNNYATVNGTVTIKDIVNGTWHELVSNNKLVFNAAGKTLNITKGVAELTINVDAIVITSQPVKATVKSGVTVTVKANADDTEGATIVGNGTEQTLENKTPEQDTEKPVIENAELVIDGKALLVKFSINETIDLSTGADVELRYFTMVEGKPVSMKNSLAGDTDLVKNKDWAGYLANVNEPAGNYSSGKEGKSYPNEIKANTLIGSKIQNGYQNSGDMDYVEITDFSITPGEYVVEIIVTDNASNVSETKTVKIIVPVK